MPTESGNQFSIFSILVTGLEEEVARCEVSIFSFMYSFDEKGTELAGFNTLTTFLAD
jgi:hypothetical protein